MKILILTTLVIFAVILFPSCFGETNPTEVQEGFTEYPLTVGNSWQYEQEAQYFNLRPDSIMGYLPATVRKYSSTVRIEKDVTLMDSIETHVIREEVYFGGSLERYAEKYYSNQSDGFFLHAYSGLSGILPKIGYHTLKFKNKTYKDMDHLLREITIKLQYPANSVLDSIYFEIPPLMVLPYPLQIGQSWNLRGTGDPFKIDKKVVDRETINCPAGRFVVDTIQWLYDFEGYGQWDEDIIYLDYYSSIGLVKRSIIIKNVAMVDQSGFAIGYVDYFEISELQTYAVH